MGNTISYNTTPYEINLGPKGNIVGLQLDNKSRRYTGIPYALPPTGEYRWRRPRPLPASYTYANVDGGPYNATQFKPVCPQNTYHVGSSAEGGDGDGAYSEDCLFVNIWTPVPRPADTGSSSKKWPVMLWLHGGWFQMGDPSQEPGMDPTELISTGGLGAVVVSIGYRLNVFGFLAGQDVSAGGDGDNLSSGNFGLWDQRQAAEWVWENIGFFNGDRDNITLAGRSAGAYSVEAQMLYEFRRLDHGSGGRAAGLFRRFFMDSNAIPAQPKSMSDAQRQFDELCAYFNLKGDRNLTQLRRKSAQELLSAIPNLKAHTFRPVTDDRFIHSGMIQYLQSKDFASEFQTRGCRLLIGEVLNEETLYSTYNSPAEPTLESLRSQIANYYAPHVTDRALKRYKLPESTELVDWQRLYGQIISDGQVRAPSRALVYNLAKNGVDLRNIWRYKIAYRLSFIDESVAPLSFGVAHAMDKPFWNFSISYGPTPTERILMEEWIQNLVAFVDDDSEFEFGTHKVDEVKVISPNGTIEVTQDERWEELLAISASFAQ